jgi:rhodanese-related sulfurtransferase
MLPRVFASTLIGLRTGEQTLPFRCLYLKLQTAEGHLDHMKEITARELKQAIDAMEDFQLVDVREVHEHEVANIGGELIPMSQIPHNTGRFENGKRVIFYCRSGARSGNIIQWLELNYGYTNLYNLRGGLLAWKKEIDSSIEVI